ncbi:MAG: hypothetical protein DLM58_08270 [Pseudonocardiales bacterium]|nr:MAG: hypothetical protein DLM58_08270 [Pseudonocardiales bacterium]
MCAEHWRRLDPALRSEVHRSYQARLQAQLRLRAGSITTQAFASTAARHEEACQRAVAAAAAAPRRQA